MKHPHRRWLLVTIALVLGGSSLQAQDNPSNRRLYDDPLLFEQLSSAKQNQLIAIYGRKKSKEGSFTSTSAKAVDFMQSSPPGNSLSMVVNTLVNNAAADATAQDTQSETGLVLGSGGVVVCGFNDSGSFMSNNHFTGSSRSTDSGTTWTDLGILPNSTQGDAGDPVLARNNTTGTIYLATLAFTNSQNLSLFRSTDNGASWLAPVNSAPGFTTTTGNQDKEWIAVDNFVGAGNGNVYQFWRNFGTPGGMTFTRSTDDGLTWGPSGGLTLATGGQGAWVAVGPDHTVYCFWLSGTSISLRKSTDQGVSFAAATTVTTLLTTGVNGDLGLGFRSNAFPQVAVNPVSGHLYMTYNDNPAGVDRGDIYFRHSTDGGATWSAQVRVNNDAGTNDQWQPAITVRPDGTGLSICWYDRRTDLANSLIERWGVTATISGATVTFDPNFKLSPSFPAVYGVDPVINSVYMGDYDQMAADNSFYYTVWGDNRDQSIAVPARKNANVRFAKFGPGGPPPAPSLAVSATAVTAGNGNGLVDPNECNNYAVTLRNDGNALATGVSATLSTTVPNVTIFTNTATYPDIIAGGTANSVLPFRISTSSSYSCGTPIPVKVAVSYSSVTDTFDLSVPVNSAGYALTQSAGNAIVPGTTDIGNHGDDVTTNIVLPFSYQFYGQTYTSVNASSNGNLQFVSNSTAFTNACLPTTTLNYAIMPHWDDQRTDSVGRGIFTSISGAAPNRIFNIEWRTTLFTGGGSLNYEVRLYEGLQKVDIIFGTPLTNLGSSATVGLQQGTGASFAQFSCNTASLSTGLMLSYVAGTCPDGGGICVVPIQLASFSGRRLDGNRVMLEWRTVSELNNYGFELQKSSSQIGPFQTIVGSFVPGHGTTTEPHSYAWTDVSGSAAQPYYRLKQIDLDGTVNYHDPIYISTLTSTKEGELPSSFSLSQNYPNPFNPVTLITYALPEKAVVTLEVFNALGERVAIVVNEPKEAGYYQASFDGTSLASGVYFYRMTAGNFVDSKKLLLVK